MPICVSEGWEMIVPLPSHTTAFVGSAEKREAADKHAPLFV